MKKALKNIWGRLLSLRKDSQGFVMMSTLAIFLFLFVLCASIYAIGETIHQRIKLQNACDAAAYSAAVVQADGLSRMATVNRAMAWNYVQMTNHQMDYITYRWLKLTCTRFAEDKENARAYAEDGQMIALYDKEIGWWALIEAAVSAAVIRTLNWTGLTDFRCDTGNHKPEHEGWTWWCGAPKYKGTDYAIRLNAPLDVSVKGAVSSSISNFVSTYGNLNSVVTTLGKVIDQSNGKEPAQWGYWLGELIDYDKDNIKSMNNALERINNQMNVSMRLTAENVLKSMLKDNRLKADKVLEDYYISIRIPEGSNPYKNMDKRSSQPKSFFSPLRNTEADERLFLQMQSTKNADSHLAAFFPCFLGFTNTAYGLDQWFIRGKGNYNERKEVNGDNVCTVEDEEANDNHCYDAQTASASFNGTSSGWVSKNSSIRLLGTQRDEGALGIQRVYKDSNLNETEAGLKLFKLPVDRGNHIANFALMAQFGSSSDSSNRIAKIMESVLNSVMTYFVTTFGDIQASTGNEKDAFSPYFGMCKQVNDTAGLYADYEWASAKWVCLSTAKAYSYTILKEGLTSRVWCDMGRQGKKPSNWNPILSRSHWKKSNGYGHWEFPKWFCGSPAHGMQGSIPGSLDGLLLGMIPPTFGERIGDTHGYMKHTLDLSNFAEPLKPLLKKKSSYSRDEYNSCAAFLDGPFRPDKGDKCPAGYLQGHARIYGDDKEIFDNRYVGAKCMPWVLNEKFFAGDGTIVVGAAMKHRNPFVQLFNMLNSGSEEKVSEQSVLSAFDIPDGNYMWTMSAARAGVRHRRRDGKFDQERQYQITYDATSDVENLHYNGTPVVYVPNQGDKDQGTWSEPGQWAGAANESNSNPNALSRATTVNQNTAPIWNGCTCCGAANAIQFKNMWNLCEADWDATLLPLRYAGRKAVLKLAEKKDQTAEPLNEKTYTDRIKLIAQQYTNSGSDGKTVKEQNDMYIGRGESWEWSANSTALTSNPFLSLNSSWKRADATFFEDILSATPVGNLMNDLNLETRFPREKDGTEAKTRSWFLLQNNRIL